MERKHHYRTTVTWTGNRGSGTLDYRAYSRDHRIAVDGKTAPIEASSDPLFRGDAARYNPEELFVASLASCHMLWYLHLASVNDVVVLNYEDRASGTMAEAADGSGRFVGVRLHPRVTIADPGKRRLAEELHAQAGKKCFIANSVNFPVEYAPEIVATS